MVQHRTVKESGMLRGTCFTSLHLYHLFVEDNEDFLCKLFCMSVTGKGDKSVAEVPVDVSEMHPVTTPFIRDSQWHCQALAVFTCSS